MSLSERMEAKRHNLFESMVAAAERLLQEHGVPEKASTLVANALADEIAALWGGQNINMPKEYHRVLSKRDIEVHERFDGTNQAELAREFGLTERGMYKVIKRIRERLKKQAGLVPDLFSNG